jgi:hypothetical protein
VLSSIRSGSLRLSGDYERAATVSTRGLLSFSRLGAQYLQCALDLETRLASLHSGDSEDVTSVEALRREITESQYRDLEGLVALVQVVGSSLTYTSFMDGAESAVVLGRAHSTQAACEVALEAGRQRLFAPQEDGPAWSELTHLEIGALNQRWPPLAP